ncbi:Rrp15p-domain-containing protein [Lipomyces starkeyi]
MPGSTTLDGKKRKAYPVIVANQKQSKTVSSKGRSSKNLHQKEKGSYSNKKRKLVEKGASSNYEYAESFDELSDDEELVHKFDVAGVSRGEEQDIYEDNSTDGDEPRSDSNDEEEVSDDNDEKGAEVQEEDDDDAEGDFEAESELDDDEEIENITAAANEKRTKRNVIALAIFACTHLTIHAEKKRTDPEAFSSAMTAILSSHLKAHDRKDPVLVRSKQTAKAIEESKLEAKARRELRLEKKQFLDKERIKDVITGIREGETPNPDAVQMTTERERMLKKTAKRGVVKLFNTVIEAQKKATDALAV